MTDLVVRALRFAFAAHRHQVRRYTGEPYTLHLAEVVAMVSQTEYGSWETIAAAWLHDVLEDTNTKLEALEREFGETVAHYVWQLTDCPIKVGNRAQRKAMDRALLSKAGAEVQTIKVADLISNTPSIVKHDPDFAKTYLTEKRALLGVLLKAPPALYRRAWDMMETAEVELYGPLARLAQQEENDHGRM